MNIPFVPLGTLEHAASVLRFCTPMICHSYLAFEDERVTERRWLERRLVARDEPDRRVASRRDAPSEVERAVFDHLREFCTPELRAELDAKFAPALEIFPIVRESARFLKAA